MIELLADIRDLLNGEEVQDSVVKPISIKHPDKECIVVKEATKSKKRVRK